LIDNSPSFMNRRLPWQADYQRLAALQREIELITANKDQLESAWLQAAEVAG
jgi:hypothetical protein